MPDILMCLDKQCPSRKRCYRYRAIPTPLRQSYFSETPRKGLDCSYFLPVRGQLLMDIIKLEEPKQNNSIKTLRRNNGEVH